MNIDKSHQIRYGLLVIVSGLMAAISLVLTEITIHQYQTAPLLIAILGNALGGVILLLADRWKRPIMKYSWSRRDLGRLAIAALFTYSLSYLFGFDAVRRIGAGRTALLALLETPFVVASAVLFLNERLSSRHWLAGLMALGGSLLIAFDPEALRFQLGWGEIEAILSPMAFAIGIIVIKPVLEEVDARWATGIFLLVGAALLSPLIPFFISGSILTLIPLLFITLIGLLRGAIWLAYNLGLKHIGASRSAILYLSFSFFAVAIQWGTAKAAPALGLQLPSNLKMALLGGALVAAGIVLFESKTEPQGEDR